jgi:hypothetical protein
MPRPENANGGVPSCDHSNQGEIMYVRGPGRSLLVHEAKHITSGGYEIFGARSWNPGWIEEGTAFSASEKTSRAASGIAPGQRVTAADIFVDAGIESASTQNMRAATALARVYLAAAPIASVLGNPVPNPGESNFYASSWFFHRFLEDAYGDGSGVEPFLTMNRQIGGPAGIEAATGASMDRLFGEFMLAIAVDDEPVARARTARRFSAYDFAGIGEAEYEPTLQHAPWPVVEASESYGSYEWSFDAWTTAPVFFDFSASSTSGLVIEVLRKDGGPVDPEQRFATVVVRLE